MKTQKNEVSTAAEFLPTDTRIDLTQQQLTELAVRSPIFHYLIIDVADVATLSRHFFR